MKRVILTLIMMFSFSGLFAQTNNFKRVGVDEFEKIIADTSVITLDVRTAEEHASGFIPETQYNIDVTEETFEKIATATLPKDRPIALYCRSGNRSQRAARILVDNGYQVVELDVGFRGWQMAGKGVAMP